MKKFCILAFSLLQCGAFQCQDWTWVRGQDTSIVPGTYGTLGVASAANDPGGRHGCATWTDKAGNLWLFGGEGFANNTTLCWLNDLWKYDKATNQWTWMRGSNAANAAGSYGTLGVASPSNDPGAREFMVSWTDTAGKFWLFGGDGFDAASNYGKLGDLWRYDPATNQWTWMKGFNAADQNGVYGTQGISSPSSQPGGRYGSGYWRDKNNNLWLLGGVGYPASGTHGYLQDLWKYQPATNEWTWVKGANAATQTGSYGTFSVTSSANVPGGRAFPACWYGKDGNFYMFGGVGHSTLTLLGHLADLWKYEPASNNWTWIGGPIPTNQNGDYGVLGQQSPAVRPGSRQSAASWVDALGNLWLFGGLGYPGQGQHANLNDLLRYNIAIGQWTWMKGDTTGHMPGVYGTPGVSAPTNKPGGRNYNSWWKTGSDVFWLFGGLGRDKNVTKLDNMNDLWKFATPCNPDSIMVSGNMFCSGSTATLSVIPPDTSAISWYISASATVALATGSTLVTAPLNSSQGTTTYTYYASAASCSSFPRSAVILTVHALPQLTISGSTVFCHGQSFTLTASGAQTYTWNTGSNNAVAGFTAAFPGSVAVVLGTDQNGCENSTMQQVSVHPLPTITAAPSKTLECINSPVTFSASGASSYSWSNGQTVPSFTLNNIPAGTHQFMVTGYDMNGCSATASFSFISSECLGLLDFSSRSLILYPNPAKNHLVVSAEEPPGTITLYDALGREVLVSESRTIVTQLIFDLPPGLYTLKTGSGRSARLVIE